MDCLTCQEQFTTMAESAAPELVAAAQEHLQGCPACARRYDEFRRTVKALRALPLVTPPRELLPRISRAVEAAAPQRRPVLWWQPALAGVSLAAGLAIFLMTAVFGPQARFAPLAAGRGQEQGVLASRVPAGFRTPAPAAPAARPAAPLAGPRAGRLARGDRGFPARTRSPWQGRMLAAQPRPLPVPELGNWAVAPAATPAGVPHREQPAETFAAPDETSAPAQPLQPKVGAVQLSFAPPTERTVGVPVVGQLTLDSKAEGDVTVTVSGARGLRVVNAPAGVLYRGPVRQGQALVLPVKLLARQAGTQRLRVKLTASVPVGQADLEVMVPGFAGEWPEPGQALVTTSYREIELHQALRDMASSAGARLVVHEGVDHPRVTQDYSAGVPLAAALQIMCDAAGCRVEERNGVFHILP